jgi:hypothetical protein
MAQTIARRQRSPLEKRVRSVLRKLNWEIVGIETTRVSEETLRSVLFVNGGDELIGIEIIKNLDAAEFSAFLKRANEKLDPKSPKETQHYPDRYWVVSEKTLSHMLPRTLRVKTFSIDEFESYPSSPEMMEIAERDQIRRIITSMGDNHDSIQLAATGLIALIDERLEGFRDQRPNSDQRRSEVEERIADYELLRDGVLGLADATTALKRGKMAPPVAGRMALTFGVGLEKWWKKKHDIVLDVAVFSSALTVCSLVGSGGWITAAVLGVMVGGKKIADTLKGMKVERK